MKDQCEAFYLHGGRCAHAAKHTHRDQFGDRWRLCGIHFRTILRREHHESSGALIARWREK